MPFLQMPVLEVDGKVLAQGNAIARYLAREFNLTGKDSWEQAQCDQFIDLVMDMKKERTKMYCERDENKKKELQKNMVDVVYPKFQGFFEKALESNGGSFLVGDSLTVSDLMAYCAFDTPLMNHANLMDSFPKMKAQRARIEALPNLGEYIKNRKPTDI